ncbi:MAG: hypothetical protein ACXVJB_08480 [Mucilaginibacter sp.]
MMRINQKNKLISCLTIALAIFLCPVTQAQQNKFRYKADVAKVDSDGVYKIELQPSLIAKCVQKGLYDIRLLDSHGKFVAYIISDGQSSENRADYIDFPGAKTPNGNDTATVYIAENIKQLWINKLWLKLRNTTVDRNINLEGSDDGIKWFAIKENISLQPAKDENNTNYEQVLNFPESNYRYFRIQVSGKNKVPVKIISSGIYVDKSPAKAEYTQLPDPKFTIKDTDRITTILLHFDQEYLINKLKLDIKAPRYYTRRALIHNRTGAYYYEVGGYVLSNSSGNPDMTFSEKTKKLRIDINNRDDNPLTIASIKAYQQKQFAVAYLEKGEK